MTSQTSTSSAVEARRLVDELFRGFNGHDVDAIVALHASDALWEDPMLGAPVTGHAAITDRLRIMFRAFPDITFTVDEVYLAESGRIAASWHFTGTMTGPIEPPGYAPTGKRATVPGTCLYEFRSGKLAHHTIVYDTLGLMQQVGLMPAMESMPIKLTAAAQRLAVGVSKQLRKH